MKKINELSILGVNIAITNMKEIVNYVVDNIKELSGKYICVSNVHTTIMSYDNPEYKKIQNSAAIRLPDGRPLSLVQKRKGFKEAERVTGPDLMQTLFEGAKDNKLRYYFYGSTEETLSLLEEKLKEKYPSIKVVGMYSPPFRNLTEEEDNEIIKKINDAKPDIVWIGLGAPKQEKWMYDHKNKINGLMIGVGAGFDFLAGNIKRAPKWMQKCSLEWLYRLLQDPKRLFARYMKTNFKFMWLIFRGK